MCYLPKINELLFIEIHGGTDQFKCTQCNGRYRKPFSLDSFFYFGTPDDDYRVKRNLFF